jgi:hypothetical protein
MAYSKAKLKSSGDKASPCFRPFWIGKLSDKCLPKYPLKFITRWDKREINKPEISGSMFNQRAHGSIVG